MDCAHVANITVVLGTHSHAFHEWVGSLGDPSRSRPDGKTWAQALEVPDPLSSAASATGEDAAVDSAQPILVTEPLSTVLIEEVAEDPVAEVHQAMETAKEHQPEPVPQEAVTSESAADIGDHKEEECE